MASMYYITFYSILLSHPTILPFLCINDDHANEKKIFLKFHMNTSSENLMLNNENRIRVMVSRVRAIRRVKPEKNLTTNNL